MKMYQAIDKLDNTDSFFLVYPNGEVVVLSANYSIDRVRSKVNVYERDSSDRFDDAVNPVLVAEWE